MRYFIGGENSFESKTILDKTVQKSVQEGYAVNAAEISDEAGFTKILNMSGTMGLFMDKVMVLVKGYEDANAEIKKKVLELAEQTEDMILYTRGNIDKRDKVYKFFKEKGEVYEKKSLKGQEISKWLNSYVRSKGLEIDRNLLAELVLKAGTDQMILSSEIDKLLALQEEKVQLTKEVFNEIVSDTQTVDIWTFIDKIRADKAKSLDDLSRLMKDVEYEYIAGLFARQIRLLFLALKFGNREALVQTGMHPFVASKILSQVRGMRLDRIIKLYKKMINIDIAVKSGNLDKSLALDMLILAF